MPTSDEDLQKKADRVKTLRQQVARAEATRIDRERSVANDIQMTQLEAEEAALEARLAVAKEAGKVSVVRDGIAAPLDAAKDQLAAAVAQQQAATESANTDASAASTSATSDKDGK